MCLSLAFDCQTQQDFAKKGTHKTSDAKRVNRHVAMFYALHIKLWHHEIHMYWLSVCKKGNQCISFSAHGNFP